MATGATGLCRQREAKEVKNKSPGTQRIGIEVNGSMGLRHFTTICACPEMGGTLKIVIPFFLTRYSFSQEAVVSSSSHYDWNDSPIYHDNVL